MQTGDERAISINAMLASQKQLNERFREAFQLALPGDLGRLVPGYGSIYDGSVPETMPAQRMAE